MGANGHQPVDLAGGVDLAQTQVPVTRRVTTAPLHTEASVAGLGVNAVLEVNVLVTEGGEPVAYTYNIGRAGIESIKEALKMLQEAEKN